MTKSQRAIAVAMIYPESGKGGREKMDAAKANPEIISGFHFRLVQWARAVLQ